MNAHWTKSLVLSERSLLLSNPNPRVGCVLVAAGDRVIGEGHTQQAGAPHAEVMALRDARARGESVAGATAYVTLEPCSHFGRTPPCCDALIEANIGRVLVATVDPNPRVAGQGLERLRSAGIQVDLLPTDHPAAIRSRELNIGFFSRMIRGTPWVRMKIAASLDGITALPNGQSQWITGEAAREDGHLWRARACAVLTGAGTVLEDNPRLDARLPNLVRQPHLAVIDSRLDTPPNARLFEPPYGGLPRRLWFFHAEAGRPQADKLRQCGADTILMPGANGKVDLGATMRELGRREVNELHVEAGAKLNASLLREGWVDELLVYLAPRLLGQGAGMAPFGPLERLADGTPLRWLETQVLGTDLRLRARIDGRDAFLTNR